MARSRKRRKKKEKNGKREEHEATVPPLSVAHARFRKRPLRETPFWSAARLAFLVPLGAVLYRAAFELDEPDARVQVISALCGLVGGLLLADGIYTSAKGKPNHVLGGAAILSAALFFFSLLGWLGSRGIFRALEAAAVAVFGAYGAIALGFLANRRLGRYTLPSTSSDTWRIILGAALMTFAAFLQIRLALAPGLVLPGAN